MVAHATLTDPELHEPKGVASASANTVYRANGSGAGTWGKVTAAVLDTATVFNINRSYIAVPVADIGTAGTVFVPLLRNGAVTAIAVSIQAAIAGTSTVLTFSDHGGTTMATLTFAVTGSSAGAVERTAVSTSNAFTVGQTIRITSDGAASNVVPAIVLFEFTITS